MTLEVGSTMNPILEVEGLSKRFGDRVLFEDLHLEVKPGERFFILGPSGCGKTTLLRMIAGLEPADRGTIRVQGRTVEGPGVRRSPAERDVGFVFQEGALWPHLSVEQHLAYPSRARDDPPWIDHLLELSSLASRRKDRPAALSGGERQRVALCRALAGKPSLLLLDEPLRNLDRNLALELRESMVEILERTGTTALYVTHDQEEAFAMAHRILLLSPGGPIQSGSPEEIFLHPRDLRAAAFFGPVNRVEGITGPRGTVKTPLGEFPTDMESGTACTLIFRPGDLGLAVPGKEGIPARIVRRSFMGDRYLLLCETDGCRLRVLTPPPVPQEGSTVSLVLRHPPLLFPRAGGEKGPGP